ncbi:MAG: right-handed parallel beta-helix repeat-containing protein [candidate division Zixibacteria bacterium]|nr:right-handed parallel beta-helix repeat-containing protein [candidate division Zixibacteria bacterium]
MCTLLKNAFFLSVQISILLVLNASARIINIPAEYSTIQEGVYACSFGDTVLVHPGTYTENVVIDSVSIMLGSLFLTTGDTSYIQSTIIDGDSSGSVIRFYIWGDSTSIISGFTLTNGAGVYGGGGVYCYGSPLISGNIIYNNRASRGGGIFVSSGNPLISNNVIKDNHATVAGAGIVSYGGACIIANNRIYDNISTHYGGGIHIEDSGIVTLLHNAITNNFSEHNGGGVIFYAEGSGGIVIGNLIADNTSAHNSGIGFSHGDYHLTNNTIYNNGSDSIGLGFFQCYAVLTNNIIWNYADHEIVIYEGENVSITYSDIRGGWEGEGNISEDPLFCFTDTAYYWLAENSPCVGAGMYGVDIGAFGIGCGEQNGILQNDKLLPTSFSLYQNYPNPFNPVTTISFTIPSPQFTSLKVYSIIGSEIQTLVNEYKQAGFYTYRFDASDFSSGIYFYRLQAGDYAECKRMMLLK